MKIPQLIVDVEGKGWTTASPELFMKVIGENNEIGYLPVSASHTEENKKSPGAPSNDPKERVSPAAYTIWTLERDVIQDFGRYDRCVKGETKLCLRPKG